MKIKELRFDNCQLKFVIKSFMLNQSNFKETKGIVIYEGDKLDCGYFKLLTSIFPNIQVFCKIK